VTLRARKAGEFSVESRRRGICHTDEFTFGQAQTPKVCSKHILGHEGRRDRYGVGEGVTTLKHRRPRHPAFIPHEMPPVLFLPVGKNRNLCTAIPKHPKAKARCGRKQRFSISMGRRSTTIMGCSTFANPHSDLPETRLPKSGRKTLRSRRLCYIGLRREPPGSGTSSNTAESRSVHGGGLGLADRPERDPGGCAWRARNKIIGVDLNDGKEVRWPQVRHDPLC